jgi:hypothetical protein
MIVYPNPSQTESTVALTLADETFVNLKVVNVVGQEIKVLNNQKLLPGQHRFVFDTSSLANGLYYYQLTSGDNRIVQKFVVTR